MSMKNGQIPPDSLTRPYLTGVIPKIEAGVPIEEQPIKFITGKIVGTKHVTYITDKKI